MGGNRNKGLPRENACLERDRQQQATAPPRSSWGDFWLLGQHCALSIFTTTYLESKCNILIAFGHLSGSQLTVGHPLFLGVLGSPTLRRITSREQNLAEWGLFSFCWLYERESKGKGKAPRIPHREPKSTPTVIVII